MATNEEKAQIWIETYSMAMQSKTGKSIAEKKKIEEARRLVRQLRQQEGVSSKQSMLKKLTGKEVGNYNKAQDAWVLASGKISYQGPRGPQARNEGQGGVGTSTTATGTTETSTPETRDLFTIEQEGNQTNATQTTSVQKRGTRKTAGGRRRKDTSSGLKKLPGEYGSPEFVEAGLERLRRAKREQAALASRRRKQKISSVAETVYKSSPLGALEGATVDTADWLKGYLAEGPSPQDTTRQERQPRKAKTQKKISEQSSGTRALGGGSKSKTTPKLTYKKKRPKNKNIGGGR